MREQKRYLILYTVGPVQSYIVQAARLYDLYAGSGLLSKVIEIVIGQVTAWNASNRIIFPYTCHGKSVGGSFQSYPNRCVFIAYDSDDQMPIQERMKILDEHVRTAFFEETFLSNREVVAYISQSQNESLREHALAQLKEHLKTYWAVVPYPETESDPYKECYEKLERLMGAVKTVRTFRQCEDGALEKREGFLGRCQICGEENALFYNKTREYRHFLRPGEKLCAVCYQKRCFKKEQTDHFPSARELAMTDFLIKLKECDEPYWQGLRLDEKEVKENGKIVSKDEALLQAVRDKRESLIDSDGLSWDYQYYAVVVFDGDSFGKWIGGCYFSEKDRREGQEALTNALSTYTEWLRNNMKQDLYESSALKGRIIYSGGEDFLALIPLRNLFSSVRELRLRFKELVSDKVLRFCKEPKCELTISMGIAIAHCKTPLRYMLQKARAMEGQAKRCRKMKNALSISLMKRSGEEIQVCLPWETELNREGGLLLELVDAFRKNQDAFTFVRKLHSEYQILCEERLVDVGKESIMSEMNRLLQRSVQAGVITPVTKKTISVLLMRLLLYLENHNARVSELFSILYICEFVRASRNENTDQTD